MRNFSEIAKHKSQMYRAELLDILDTVAIRNALNKYVLCIAGEILIC